MDAERVADIRLRIATLEREEKELEAAPWEIMLAQGRLANALEQIALNGRER